MGITILCVFMVEKRKCEKGLVMDGTENSGGE